MPFYRGFATPFYSLLLRSPPPPPFYWVVADLLNEFLDERGIFVAEP
jgi:hypothetical protein